MNRTSFLLLAALAPLGTASPARAGSMREELLAWATTLVSELAPENNVYGSHPTFVEWGDPASGRKARNRSVCSSFASHLLEQSFGYTARDIDAWFGKRLPQAIEYHDTISAGRGFLRISHVGKIQPGDIIAIAYPAGSRPTGHVMLAASQAHARAATAPLRADTRQYEIEVIDSANTGHGQADTRRRSNGTWTTGVGRGTLRLYGRADDTIAGYAWSTSSRSLFRPATVRKPAVGRLDPALVPQASGMQGTSPGTMDGEPSPDDARFDDAS
jgi:hypothetical protein